MKHLETMTSIVQRPCSEEVHSLISVESGSYPRQRPLYDEHTAQDCISASNLSEQSPSFPESKVLQSLASSSQDAQRRLTSGSCGSNFGKRFVKIPILSSRHRKPGADRDSGPTSVTSDPEMVMLLVPSSTPGWAPRHADGSAKAESYWLRIQCRVGPQIHTLTLLTPAPWA